LVIGLLCTAVRAGGADRVHPASEYADVDDHAKEHVAIAADPYETKERTKFFKLHYLDNDILPVLIVVTNESDRTIDLTDVRMQFITADDERLPAALPEEIVRRMSRDSDAAPRVLPAPVPIPLPARKPIDNKVQVEMDEYGFNTPRVEPHSSVEGFLWYDMHGLKKPWAAGAQIYVKMIHDADGNDLFPFTILLDKMPKE